MALGSQFLAGLVLLVFASLLASILLFNLRKRMQGDRGDQGFKAIFGLSIKISIAVTKHPITKVVY